MSEPPATAAALAADAPSPRTEEVARRLAKGAPAVELEAVDRRWGRERVLRGVSLEVAAGRIVALRGRNGSGKTTLLRMLATRLRPSAGRGRIFGHDLVREAAQVRRRTAYLSVQSGSYGPLTARENLRLAATLAGTPEDRVEAALRRVGLEPHGDRLVRVFSSGMKRRLGLARLLLTDADLWLLDEPYASLDEDGRALVDGLLDEAREEGRTVLVASHEPARLIGRVDATVELDNGVLRGLATDPSETDPSEAAPNERGGAVTEIRALLAIAAKDLRSEARSRAATVATVFFSSVTLVVLAFALGRDADLMTRAAPGVLWVALAFSGVISAAQAYQSDLADGAFEQLLTLPVPRASVFLGKLLANWLTMTLLGAVLLPVTAVLFDAPIGGGVLRLLATVALGTLGFAVIATFYAALTANLQARESLLPVLMFPVVVPVLLASVRATDAIVTGGDPALATDWIELLAGFDLVYLVVTSAIFHIVVEE